MPTSTLTSKGQMVIPKTIRDRLKLEPGDRLDFIIQEDVHTLKGRLPRPGRPGISGKGDLSDYYLGRANEKAGAAITLTFDKTLKGIPRFHVLT